MAKNTDTSSSKLHCDWDKYEFAGAKSQGSDDSSVQSTDIWRDTALRYLGYANELGEAFKPVLPQIYYPSYIAAAGYVLCDTYDKTTKAQARCQQVSRVRDMVSSAEDDYRKAQQAKDESPQVTEKTIQHVKLLRDSLSSADHGTAPPTPAAAAADTLLWQGFASVALPGLAINRVVAATQAGVEALEPIAQSSTTASAAQLRAESPGMQALRATARTLHGHPMVRRFLPTVVGLSTIPLIVEPLDTFVHRIMDRFVRPRLCVPPHFGHESAQRGAEHVLLETVGMGGGGGGSQQQDALEARGWGGGRGGDSADEVQSMLAEEATRKGYFERGGQGQGGGVGGGKGGWM